MRDICRVRSCSEFSPAVILSIADAEKPWKVGNEDGRAEADKQIIERREVLV